MFYSMFFQHILGLAPANPAVNAVFQAFRPLLLPQYTANLIKLKIVNASVVSVIMLKNMLLGTGFTRR